MAAHAELSASGSATWLNCAGSVEAQRQYGRTSSRFADEGTAAHTLAEICLTKEVSPFTYENILDPETGITITHEMCGHVQTYLDYIAEFAGEKFFEQKVNYSDYAPEGFGTADCIIIDGDTLHIVDLKYGKGIKVYADSTQLSIYALGAVHEFGFIYDIKTIKKHIVQPRLDNIDMHEMSIDELLQFGEEVKEKAKLAMLPGAPRTPGEKQCQWCSHKARCPELLKMTQDTLMGDFDNLTQVNTLSDEQLANALSHATLIKSWLSAVEDTVRAKLESGEAFEGFKIVEGRSSRDWADQSIAEAVLSKDYAAYELYETSFISVAKAEKLVGKKNMDELNDIIIKKSGKPTLVPASDKRPALGICANDFD
jgi:hypothetical protein